ncbi:MAG: sigma-70 family RNA polymerase sigma factor [Planctomycetes bacterium]|nr:sigma-70 family RNA polymerase sigma factor [Planctomycetota bacterium]
MAQLLDHFAREHAAHAWNLAYALVQDAHDADDVMQQAFVVAARKMPEDAAWPWFASVIANTARNTRRRRARTAHEEYMDTQRDVRAADPRAAAEQAELLARLRSELAALPEHEREAISLTHLAGLTFAQAANAAGVPGSTLSDRAQSGLRRLRSRLDKPEEQLARGVALLLFPLPKAGLESAVQTWLAGARATVPASGGPRPRTLAMLKPILFAVAALLLLVAGAVTLTQRRAPNTNSDPISSTRSDDEFDAPGNFATPRNTKATHVDAGTRTPSNDDGAKAADNTAVVESTPKMPPTPVAAATTATINGICTEISYRNGVRINRTTPVAGATVWIRFRSATLDDKTRSLAEKLDPLKFSTTSAADGSFHIENAPIGAEATVYMAHPAYYCGYTGPLAVASDYLHPDAEVPEAVANYRRISDDHVTMRGRASLADDSAVELTVTHGTEAVTLGAARGCWVSGRVVGRHGEDVAAARISASRSTPGHPAHYGLDTQSKADGTYRIGPFLRGAKVHFWASVGEKQNIGASEIVMPEADEFKYDILMGFPDFESSKGIVRAVFKPLNEEQARIRTLEARQGGAWSDACAHLDGNGVALFGNLERTINYRIFAKDSRGVIVAQSDWFQPTHESMDITLEPVTLFSLKVGVAQGAFAESEQYFTKIIRADVCRGLIATTLAGLLEPVIREGSPTAHSSADDFANLAVNDDGPMVLIAFPKDVIAGTGKGIFQLDRDAMARIWISDVFEGSADHVTEVVANHKLQGMTLKGKTPGGENFAAEHLVIWCQPLKFATDADGKYETDWLWPGKYSAFWRTADLNESYIADEVELQGKPGDAVTYDFKEPRLSTSNRATNPK